jgi:glycosyltransferase involved in cell wall biosynthesis
VRVGVAPERIVVMPNAVDTQRICPGPSALKQALGAELMVSFLGRLDPEKRVEELIHSFLARRWPSDHLLVIAGSGSQDRRLRAIAGPEGAVRFLGMVTRMEDRLELLRATDLFVLPSTAEGLSLALLEAMAAGCAIVATDAGEHGAVLDGAGLVIPVYPLEPALGEAMERLRGDPAARRRLGEAARSRAVAHHSLDAYVADLLGLYASAAAGHEVGSALR